MTRSTRHFLSLVIAAVLFFGVIAWLLAAPGAGGAAPQLPAGVFAPIAALRASEGQIRPFPAADVGGASAAPSLEDDGGGIAGTPPPTDTVSSGLASYCLPTPTHCHGWGGRARLGAVPSFRWGDRPYTVRVCRQDSDKVCITVRVVSYCGCGNKIIDLSGYAFTRLAPLSRGVVRVTIVRRGSLPPLPATDTGGGA